MFGVCLILQKNAWYVKLFVIIILSFFCIIIPSFIYFLLLFLKGCAQVSLADFSPESVSTKWYNILGSEFLQPRSLESATVRGSTSVKSESTKIEASDSRREESSDESTIISSQASTLTRPAVMESCAATFCLAEEEEEDVLEQIFPLEVIKVYFYSKILIKIV